MSERIFFLYCLNILYTHQSTLYILPHRINHTYITYNRDTHALSHKLWQKQTKHTKTFRIQDTSVCISVYVLYIHTDVHVLLLYIRDTIRKESYECDNSASSVSSSNCFVFENERECVVCVCVFVCYINTYIILNVSSLYKCTIRYDTHLRTQGKQINIRMCMRNCKLG